MTFAKNMIIVSKVVLTLLLALICLGCQDSKNEVTYLQDEQRISPQEFSDDTTQDFIVPIIIIQTVDELVTNLPKEGRIAILSMKEEREMGSYHHGFGMSIRNSYNLWSDSPLANSFKEIGIWHADDMSATLLASVWRRVHGEEVNIEERARFYKAYWLENKRLKDEPCPHCSDLLVWNGSGPLVYAIDPKPSYDDYILAKFPEVNKSLHWYKCPNGHEYVWTSESGIIKPKKKHLDYRERRLNNEIRLNN